LLKKNSECRYYRLAVIDGVQEISPYGLEIAWQVTALLKYRVRRHNCGSSFSNYLF